MKTFTYFPASKKLQKWPAAELSTSPLVIFLFFQPPPTHCEFLLSWLCFFGVDLFTYLFFSSGLCLSVCEYLGESTLEGIWYSLLPASVWIATAAPGGQGIHICRSHTSQNIVFLKTPSTHSHTTSAQTIVHSLNPQNQWTHKYWKRVFTHRHQTLIACCCTWGPHYRHFHACTSATPWCHVTACESEREKSDFTILPLLSNLYL